MCKQKLPGIFFILQIQENLDFFFFFFIISTVIPHIQFLIYVCRCRSEFSLLNLKEKSSIDYYLHGYIKVILNVISRYANMTDFCILFRDYYVWPSKVQIIVGNILSLLRRKVDGYLLWRNNFFVCSEFSLYSLHIKVESATVD